MGQACCQRRPRARLRSRSRLDDVASGLEDLVDAVREREISPIAIPALGCGNGGLTWDELLATVHSAAVQEPPSRGPRDLNARVAAWSLRKARLFTEQHVGLAADRLIAHELMPTA